MAHMACKTAGCGKLSCVGGRERRDMNRPRLRSEWTTGTEERKTSARWSIMPGDGRCFGHLNDGQSRAWNQATEGG